MSTPGVPAASVEHAEVLWRLCEHQKLTKKSQGDNVKWIHAELQDVEGPRKELMLTHVPKTLFEDVDSNIESAVAIEMICKAIVFKPSWKSEVLEAFATLKAMDQMSPLKAQSRTAKTEAREAVRSIIAEERKNEDVELVAGLFPRQVPAIIDTPAASSVKRTLEHKEEDDDEMTKETVISKGQVSFRNPLFLYSVQKWREVPEEVYELERQLRREFIVNERSWEGTMVADVVEVLMLWAERPANTEIGQMLLDKVLVRLKLSQQGYSGTQISEAMTRLNYNRMPKEYRTMIPKEAQASHFRPKTTPNHNSYNSYSGNNNNKRRSNSTSRRVPPELWATLTEDQKKVLRGK
jgi:hypothetical protein